MEKYKDAGWKLPMKEDPRITPIGKIIRSLTIDEFPQLLSVLKGDMSLVGPRAYREEELREYEAKYPKTKTISTTSDPSSPVSPVCGKPQAETNWPLNKEPVSTLTTFKTDLSVRK